LFYLSKDVVEFFQLFCVELSKSLGNFLFHVSVSINLREDWLLEIVFVNLGEHLCGVLFVTFNSVLGEVVFDHLASIHLVLLGLDVSIDLGEKILVVDFEVFGINLGGVLFIIIIIIIVVVVLIIVVVLIVVVSGVGIVDATFLNLSLNLGKFELVLEFAIGIEGPGFSINLGKFLSIDLSAAAALGSLRLLGSLN